MRLQSERKQFLLRLGGIFFVTALISLVMFLVLRIDYDEVKRNSDAMLEIETEAKSLLKMNTIKKSNFEKIEQGLSSIGVLESGSEKIENSKAAKKDYIVKEYSEKISKKIGAWVELKKVGQVLLQIVQENKQGDLSIVISELKKSDNKQLKNMSKELSAYQKHVNDFKSKYGSGKAENYAEMQNEYGVIMAEGETIKDKYEKMDYKKYVGLNEKEMLSVFDDLKELKKYIEER